MTARHPEMPARLVVSTLAPGGRSIGVTPSSVPCTSIMSDHLITGPWPLSNLGAAVGELQLREAWCDNNDLSEAG